MSLEEHSHEIKTFEEFNKAIDESKDEGCSFCFSFHHYKHLDSATRHIAYLGYIGDDSYHKVLTNELERLETEPMNDNIYWLISHIDPQAKLDDETLVRLQLQLIRRATEMVEKKMPAAWVAVRAFMWTDRADPLWAYGWLSDTDDLDVWQVVFQQTSWDQPRRENFKSLGLSAIRQRALEYTLKAIDMGDETKPVVVACNGLEAMASLQHPKVLEVYPKLHKHKVMSRWVIEHCDRQIAYLTKFNQLDYIPTLEKLKSLAQESKNNPAP